MYTVRIRESISSVGPEWDSLADAAGVSPFHRPGWIEAWAAAFSDRPVEVLTVSEGERLEGVLPIVRRRGAVASPTNWHTPVFGPVADSDAAHAALAEALTGMRAARVDLALVDSEDPGLEALRRASSGRRRVIERTAMRSPYVPLEGDFDLYRAGLARKQRKELGRLARRLADEGAVAYEFADGTERLDELLEEGFAVEGSGWKSEGGSAIVSQAETRRFYTDVARWAAGRGTLVLAFLRLDGRPLAFDMCIEEAGACNVLKGGFDPDYRRFGPGTLLTAASIERAYAEGLRSYELLGKEDAYKLAWTDKVRERVRFQAFARSPAGRVSHLAWTRGRALAKRAQGARRRDQRPGS